MTSLILLLLLQPQDAGTPLTEALMQAAEQALGPGASVVARTLPVGETSETAELQAARAEQAFAVARVAWEPRRASSSSSSTGRSSSPEPCCSEARISVTIVSTRRRATQSLSFAPSDAMTERGRAVGLVLAALTDPERATRIAETRGATAPRDVAAATPSGATPIEKQEPQRTPSTAPSSDNSGSPASRTPPAVTAVPAAAPTTPGTLRWALDALGEQGIAVNGVGTGAGGAIGVRWVFSPRLAFRGGVRGRFGDVGPAQASSRALAASLGAAITLLPTRTALVGASERVAEGGHFGLGLRADALLLNESLSHLSTDDPTPVRNGRWLPGGALMAEASWSMTPAAALLLDAGPELAFGNTRVFVHDAEVATLAPLRLVIQAGLLARF